MNNRLEEIKKLLPDNDNGDITEKDMRDAFAMTFDEIQEGIVSGRNLLRNSTYVNKPMDIGGIVYVGELTGMVEGETYIITSEVIQGRVSENEYYLNQRLDWSNGTPQSVKNGVPFVATKSHKHLWLWGDPETQMAEHKHIMVQKGNKPTDWTPAPEDKMDKPTAILSEPNMEYKYVVILDEQGNTKRMLAGDLGKNSANADLTTTGARTFTQAHNYTHNTAGYYYYLTGLADKSADTTFSRMRVQDAHGQEAWSNGKVVLESLMANLSGIKDERTGNYDLNFSEYLVFNPTTRKLAKSDRPQIVSNFNVPSNITIRHNSQVSNVNWVAPPSIPQDVNNTIELIKNIEQLGFTKIPTSAFVMKKLPASSFPSVASNFNIPNFEFRDGEIFFNSNNVNVPAGFRDLAYQSRNENKALINLYINQELPSDRDWVVRFRNFNSHLLGNNFHSFLGFRENISDNVSWDVMNDLTGGEEGIANYRKKLLNGKGFGFARDYTDYSCVDFYIIKKGAIISILIMDYRNGEKLLTTTTYNNTMKYIVFGANLNFSVFNKFYIKDISYWIDN